jgi:hypothetical protein
MSIINLNQKPAVRTEVFQAASKQIEKACLDEGTKHLEASYKDVVTKVDPWKIAYESLIVTTLSFSSGYFVYDFIGGKNALYNSVIATFAIAFNTGMSMAMLNYLYKEAELGCLEHEIMKQVFQCSVDHKNTVFYDEDFDVILTEAMCKQPMVGVTQDEGSEVMHSM